MRCYLKKQKVKIETLGETLEIREISAAGQAAVMDAIEQNESRETVAAISAVYCVVGWANETPSKVLENISYAALQEIGEAAAALSGIESDPKDSKSAQAAA